MAEHRGVRGVVLRHRTEIAADHFPKVLRGLLPSQGLRSRSQCTAMVAKLLTAEVPTARGHRIAFDQTRWRCVRIACGGVRDPPRTDATTVCDSSSHRCSTQAVATTSRDKLGAS